MRHYQHIPHDVFQHIPHISGSICNPNKIFSLPFSFSCKYIFTFYLLPIAAVGIFHAFTRHVVCFPCMVYSRSEHPFKPITAFFTAKLESELQTCLNRSLCWESVRSCMGVYIFIIIFSIFSLSGAGNVQVFHIIKELLLFNMECFWSVEDTW